MNAVKVLWRSLHWRKPNNVLETGSLFLRLQLLVEEAHGNKRRVIHDATHGTKINNRIKCRDKQRSPGAREKRYLLSYYRSRGDVVFSLVGDISKAHRRFLHDPLEHGLLACRGQELRQARLYQQGRNLRSSFSKLLVGQNCWCRYSIGT